METEPAANIETGKKTYVEPVLEKRDQLIEMVEQGVPVSDLVMAHM